MIPEKKDNEGNYFHQLADIGIHPNVAVFLSRLRRYAQEDGTQILYVLINQPEMRDNMYFYENLELDYRGSPDFSTIKTFLLSQKIPCELIRDSYFEDVEDKHIRAGKGKFGEDQWLSAQVTKWLYSAYGVLEDQPVGLTHDRHVYSLSYINDNLIVPGPFPAWESFISQFTSEMDKKIFPAYIFAALDETNYGRQLMYLYDSHTGRTGKSRVANALESKIPRIVSSINSGSLSKDRFTLSGIFGKRMVIYPDCKNTKILHYELVHSLTGGDLMPIEFKFKTPFKTRMYARMLIMSNDPPDVSSFKAHETSRIIPIMLDPKLCTSKEHYDGDGVFIGNNDYENQLKDQFWFFMHHCREMYKIMCPNRAELHTNPDAYNSMTNDSEAEFSSFVHDRFDITGKPDDRMQAVNVYNTLLDVYGKKNSYSANYFKAEFRTYLETLGCVYKRMQNGSDRSDRRFYFIGLRPKADPSALPSVDLFPENN